MSVFEQILQEIQSYETEMEEAGISCLCPAWVEAIIKKHLSAEDMNDSTNDGWIPVEKGLPPNSEHKGALCPRYQVMTKYGVTEGWYNPDFKSWYILVWFMTERYLDSEIDFKHGACPRMVRCDDSVNSKHNIVLAWCPLPKHYKPEKEDAQRVIGTEFFHKRFMEVN